MAIFSLAELDEMLADWKQALRSCSSGQSYTIGTRSLSRADLPEIRETLKWLYSERTAMVNGDGCQAMIVTARFSRG